MVDPLTIARIAFSFLDLGLILVQLYLFCAQYRKLRSQFTVGLILVVLALLFHTLVMNPLYHVLLGSAHLTGTFGLLALAADLFETAALVVLLYITWK